MKKIIIALMILSLMACALVSCNDGNNDVSVAESSSAQDVESSVAKTESSVADESVNDNESATASEPDESNPETSETIDESDISQDIAKEEIKVIISMEHASDELLESTEDFPFYNDPTTDYSFVVFKTDTEVSNFRYFSVVSTDTWSDDGAPKIEDVLYTIDEFTPDMFFVAETVFADVYAVRGISFVDANGNTQYYTLHDSAVDDTIGLSRADVAEKE